MRVIRVSRLSSHGEPGPPPHRVSIYGLPLILQLLWSPQTLSSGYSSQQDGTASRLWPPIKHRLESVLRIKDV